jgi:hypothetical protein
MSTIAQDANGYRSDGYALAYLRDPNVQLDGWAALSNALPHYGASQLFLRYIQEQYAGEGGLSELIRADAGNRPEAFAALARRVRPDIQSFADLVADWAVANLVNDPAIDGGRYTYHMLPQTVTPQPAVGSGEEGELQQFGVRYLQLPPGPLTLNFNGATAAALAGAPPESGHYEWWSNRGDQSQTTLTRSFDLRSVARATLHFGVWYELEKDYDYGFVAVSSDNGHSWTTLKGATTTDADPQGQNLGNGLTGVSDAPGAKPDTGVRGRWVEEQMDLTPYVGRQILLRFWVVTDTGLNYPGVLLDDFRIPELNYSDDVERGDGGWQASGFVRTTGALPQRWTLRLVRHSPNGTTVEPAPVDDAGRAHIQLNAGESGVLVFFPSTLFTSEVAHYSYGFE